MDGTIIVDGREYSAGKISDTMWIVKRIEKRSLRYPDGYTECQVIITTDEPIKAIEAAIANKSWA